MQRLRVKFSRGEELKFISHLDIVRLWERTLRRANVPILYSQGFSPHPQISLAVPLSVGMTSDAELLDLLLERPVTPQWFEGALKQQLPNGIRIIQSQQITPTLPSLQSQVRFADYTVGIKTDKTPEEVEELISKLLSQDNLIWQHQRDTGTKTYNLRALITKLLLVKYIHNKATLEMRLRCDNTGSGRPEQVTAALTLETYPESIHRTAIILNTAR